MTSFDHDDEDAPPVVVRDKRRLDPVTGELREVVGAAAPAAPAAPAATDAAAGPVDDGIPPAAELVADLQRLSAEYANYRRRVERDRLASAELATAAVLMALLPVLDDVDRARQHDDLSGAFAAVAEQLAGTLTKVGLTAFGEVGDEFDPTRHEAVMHSTSTDVGIATCVQVMRRGYALRERLLRPALVAVAEPAHQAAAPPATAEPVPAEAD